MLVQFLPQNAFPHICAAEMHYLGNSFNKNLISQLWGFYFLSITVSLKLGILMEWFAMEILKAL